VRGTDYCRSHLPLHKTEYEKWLEEQNLKDNPAVRTKYKFARKEMKKAYRQKLEAGGKLYDLKDDIAVLSALLEEILDSPRLLKHELVIKMIDQQRKCLATMNDIRKTSMMMFSQEKMNTLLERIVQVITKHVENPDTRKAIATDFVEVSKDYEDKIDK
jgi:hypothetical protein